MADGVWQLLEPVMSVECSVPAEFQGAAMSLLQQRNAVIKSTDQVDNFAVINCEVKSWLEIKIIHLLFINETIQVPLNDMFGFSTSLRSATEGKGEYSMEYSRYAPVPPAITEQIVRQFEAEQEQLNPSAAAAAKKKKRKTN